MNFRPLISPYSISADGSDRRFTHVRALGRYPFRIKAFRRLKEQSVVTAMNTIALLGPSVTGRLLIP